MDFLRERLKPMVMGDDPAHPFPEPLFWVQLGRVGRLRFEHEPSRRFPGEREQELLDGPDVQSGCKRERGAAVGSPHRSVANSAM